MTATDGPDIDSHGFSHAGNVREDNQDAIRFCIPDDEHTVKHGHLYGIADGMGGLAHGRIASSMALEIFFDTFYKTNGISVSQKLRQGIQIANVGVHQTANRLGVPRMGTTLTAVNLSGRTLNLAHVGDSRAYLVRAGVATCMTNDHTRVGEMVRMRLLTPDKVRNHVQRSILSKSIGPELFVHPDILQVGVQERDVIILCTDGIWSVIIDTEFADLSAASPDAITLSQKIFELAMNRESDDNVSVIALYIRRLASPQSGKQRQSARWSIPALVRRFRGGSGP